MSNPEGANLDLIAKRFATLEAAWKAQSGTKQLNAGFASVRAAVDNALAARAAWLKGPAWVAKPLSARAERALYLPPEAMVESVLAAEPVVSASVKCPRCLRPDAERADVEQLGVCLECSLAGFGRKHQESAPVTGAVATDAPEVAPTPPGAPGADSATASVTGNGVQSRSAYAPEPESAE